MSEDRLSQLPDAILQQILSLIDTNEAVETSILSTRWRNLSFSISDLKFHLTRFAAHRHVTLKNPQAAQSFSDHHFSHFVSHFLSLRDAAATIRTFHLSFDSRLHLYADPEFIEKCVHYAIDHGVQSLRLHARCRRQLTLNAAFFASKTLRELELRQLGHVICVPKQFSLPHLKTLFLQSSAFADADDQYYNYSSLKEPFSGFPELERLTLRWCELYRLVVKAPKLRFLEIVREDYLYSQGMEEISAPLLTWFRYEGNIPFECFKLDIPIMEEVYFNVHMKLERRNIFFNQKRMLLKCVGMFQQFGNAKIVALTLDTLKVLEMDLRLIEQSNPPFPYMKCLKLMKGRREIDRVLRRVMKYLTEGSLYLESLRVELPQGVAVVQKNSEELFEDDSDELQLQLLFGIQDQT